MALWPVLRGWASSSTRSVARARPGSGSAGYGGWPKCDDGRNAPGWSHPNRDRWISAG